MSSVQSLLIPLLCMISFFNSSNVVVGRYIGVIHKSNAPNFSAQSIGKTLETTKAEKTSYTISSQVKSSLLEAEKLKIQPNSRQMSEKIHDNARNSEEIIQNARQNHEELLHNHSKNIENKNYSEVVTWRVPKKNNNGVQETSFNQDYAPPKLHPPTHN